MNESNQEKIVTRFAPSPTGFMHVGGVRTALFAWLWARKNSGRFILRLEDTDKDREVAGSLEHIIASLKWVGMDWDEGPDIGGEHAPYKQSERLETYVKYANILIEKGLAYADPYLEEEVAEFRKKAEAEKKPFLYRIHRPENPIMWDGTKPLRFKTPIKKYKWNDLIRGDLEAGEEAVDDFVLIKSDGYPTYNFAHIIDDLLMEVTHIFRSDEFISSTPKFLALYEALEIQRPEFVTLPPILGKAGTKKLGKRDGAKDILDYQKEGYLPEAMLNFLAFIGWNPGDEQEIFSVSELIKKFDLHKVQRSGGVFNQEKLDWLNREHMKLLSEDIRNKSILERLTMHGYGNKIPQKAYPVIFDHISKWGDIDTMLSDGELDFYFINPEPTTVKLVWKEQTLSDALKHLEKVMSMLKTASEKTFESVESIKSLIFDYATENGRGQVLWPLRFSLSGREKSPDPFTLIYILGKKESLTRIESVVQKLSK